MSYPMKVSTALILGAIIGVLCTVTVLVIAAKTFPIPEKQCPGLFEGATPQQLQPLPF